MGGGEDRDEG
ncbi:hypothetical protein A2U01_0089995, partial [Trifolium medium]|nr:hypothetical protein [Trifolium medium]